VSRPQPGQGFGAELPEKDTNGWTALSSDGPTPETLSRRAMLPNGPCSLRHATMRCASAGPIRGKRVISLTSALSRSIRSPGSSGRESCAARRAVSRRALGRGAEADCSCTSPGGVAEDGARKKRTPAPANARHARTRAARLSSIMVRGAWNYRAWGVVRGAWDYRAWCVVRGQTVRRTRCVVRGVARRVTEKTSNGS